MINTRYEEGQQITYAAETGHSSGDPVLADGVTPGVAVNDSVTAGTTILRAPSSVVVLTVQAVNDSGNIAMAPGDTVYYSHGDTVVLNGKTSGVPYGILMDAIALGVTSTTAGVTLLPSQIVGAGGQGTNITFTQSPVTSALLGGASAGTDNTTNVAIFEGGELFEYHLTGTQTILAPTITTSGLLVSLDLTDTEGVEYTQGITAQSKVAYTIGTDAFYGKLTFTLADVSGVAEAAFGFRSDEAYTTVDAYTDLACLNCQGGTINIETILNNGTTTTTDTTDTWADGEEHTFEIYVSTAGVVTYKIDGVAPTVTAAFTFDTGDVVVPFCNLLHDTTSPGAIHFQTWNVGLSI
jgi:hypothetical protein